MIYRDNAIDVPTRRVWSIGHTRYAILALNLILAVYVAVWNYARIRSQPPERVVRVFVPVPGPVSIVEVPALPPPRCENSVVTYYAENTSGSTTRSCPRGGSLSRVSDHDGWLTLECHCPRTP